MRASLKKTVAGSLAALTLAFALAGAATPASATPFHPGFHGGFHGGWHRGWGGPALGLGIAGLAAGAIIASQGPYYNGYNNGCTGYAPIYDAYGNYLGQRPVNVC